MDTKPPVSTQGSTLIEVLVAALVLSIGLGGLVCAQTNALMSARQAHWQQQALRLASDYAEGVRLNGGMSLSAGPLGRWQSRLEQHLPAGQFLVTPGIYASTPTQLEIRWQAGQASKDARLVSYFNP